MTQRKPHHRLSQSQIAAMIQYGTEPMVMSNIAARREIARLRAQLIPETPNADLEDPESVLQRFNMPGALR
jgi:hypothetical protein